MVLLYLEVFDTCCKGCLEINCPYSIDGNITVEMSPQCIAENFNNIFKPGLPGFLKLIWHGRLYVCMFVCVSAPEAIGVS